MRILPILWAEPPTAEDWARLSAARIAIGHTDPIQPVQGLQGSPGTLLCIGGARPSWLQSFVACDDIENEDELQWALQIAIEESAESTYYETLLSEWMGAEVKQVGEEPYGESELG